jgi:hypothetical protein
MRIPAAIALALLLPVSAFAAEKEKPAKKPTEPGTHVQMPFLIAPVTINDKLEGYSYISSKLVASTPSASVLIRSKLAFIQDAFVREVNAQPVGKASDPRDVDTTALSARLVADAKRIVGAKNAVSIVFTQIQFSPIHPKASTEDTVPPPERVQPPQQTAATEKSPEQKAPPPKP